MRPSLLVVPVQDSLLVFKKALDGLDLPCIDFEAVVGAVVDAVSSRKEADGEIQSLGVTLWQDEFFGARTGAMLNPDDEISFYESPEDNVLGMEHIVSLAKKMGQELKQEFEAYRIYQDGETGYEYHGLIDEHAIVLRPRTPSRR